MNDAVEQQLLEMRNMDERKSLYIRARARLASKAGACKEAGLSTAWLYKLPVEEQELLERLALELRDNVTLRAMTVLQEYGEEAAVIKVKGLKSRNERIQQGTASEILDRLGVKVPDRQEQDVNVKVSMPGWEDILRKVYGGNGQRD